ncbi:MAG: hypothetical protein R3F34_14790 [Planctomycetota bacterium]
MLLRTLLGLPVALLALTNPLQDPPRQDPPDHRGGQEEGRDGQEGAAPTIVATSKVGDIARHMLEANGGPEALAKFSSLQFTLVPVTIRLKEGSTEEEPEYVEERGAEISFSASFSGDERMIRMDEPRDRNGRSIVFSKVVRSAARARDVVLFLVDGNRRPMTPDLEQRVKEDTGTVAGQFDVLLGLVSGQLRGTYDGLRERDGASYESVSAQFQVGPASSRAYRLFVDPETWLVARYEIHDLASRTINAIVRVSDYGRFEGIALPGTITFSDRKDVPFLRWELSGIRVNEPIPPAHFFVEDDASGEADGGE